MRGGNRSATGAIASLVWLSIAACAPTADVDGGLGWEVIDSAGVAVTTITGDVNELPEWTLSFRFAGSPYRWTACAITARSSRNSFSNRATSPT